MYQNIAEKIISEVITPSDSTNVKNQKFIVLFLMLLSSLGAVVWGIFCMLMKFFLLAIIPFGYVIITFQNLRHWVGSKDFDTVRTVQVLVSMLLPFIFQCLLGGIEASGATMTWGLISVLAGTMTYGDVERSKKWIYLFIGITLFCLLTEFYWKENPVFPIEKNVSGFILAFNIMGVAGLMIGVSQYYVKNEHLYQSQLSGQIAAIDKSLIYAELDVNGYFLSINHLFIKAFGLKEHTDILHKSHRVVEDELHFSEEQHFAFWRELQRGGYERGEFRFINALGRQIWLSCSYTPILDEKQNVKKVVMMGTEITKQKIRSIENENLFRALNIFGSMLEFGIDNIISNANGKFLQLLGYQIEDLLGKDLTSLMQENADFDVRKMWRSLRKEGIYQGEYKFLRNKVDIRWLHCIFNLVLDNDNIPYKVLILASDITENKKLQEVNASQMILLQKAEKENRSNATKFKNIFQKSITPILIFTPERLIECNLAALEIFGIKEKSQEEFLYFWQMQKNIHTSSNTFEEKLRSALQSQEPVTFIQEYKKRDSSSFIAHTSLASIEIEGEQVILMNLHDLTKQKLAEKRMMETIDEMEEINRQLFDYSVHEQELTQKLIERNEEIESTYHEISLQNKKMIASINYALKIQRSIIPSEKEVQLYFEDSFVLFKPKDIVSGDFYWCAQKSGIKIMVAADCTGHGVPGAFMTIFGNSFLNEIVKTYGIIHPADILDLLDDKVQRVFNKNSTDDNAPKDGMDIAVVAVNELHKKITFAGGKNPMFFVKTTGESILYKGSPRTIGGHATKTKEEDFEQNEIVYEKGDKFYIYSDGFQDQFGGEEGSQKFMSKRFRQVLLDTSTLALPQQKEQLALIFDTWKGTYPQTDDVLVMGVRL